MGLLKQLLTGLVTGHHGNKYGERKRPGHHGGYYEEPNYSSSINNNTSSSMQKCFSCQQNNPVNAKFCGQCGKGLQRNCTNCGGELALEHKFCGNCGQAT